MNIFNDTKDKWGFTQLSFLSKLDSTQGKKHQSKLVVNIPERCPICGNKDIRGTIKILNKGIVQKDYRTVSYQKTNKFITLDICKDHIYLTEINFKKESIIMFSSVLLGFFLFLLFFLFNLSLGTPLLGTIIIIIGGLYSVIGNDNKRKKIRTIENYVKIEYLPEYSTISIRRPDWAEDFKKLNDCEILDAIPKEEQKDWVKY